MLLVIYYFQFVLSRHLFSTVLVVPLMIVHLCVDMATTIKRGAVVIDTHSV